jgi:hypothetical protein
MCTIIGSREIPVSLFVNKDWGIIIRQSCGSYFCKNLKDYSSRGGDYMANLRKIKKIRKSMPTVEGAGVHLKRAFGSGMCLS